MAISKLSVLLMLVSLCGCSGTTSERQGEPQQLSSSSAASTNSLLPKAPQFYVGADLSYLNEMQDCGAEFRHAGQVREAYQLFAEAGNQLVRVRLWHNPEWTDYSDLADVTKTIRLSRAQGMQVLLDLHYSDTWADPEKQFIPSAWEHLHGDTDALGQAVYDYTYGVLKDLAAQNLLPEMIQVGNEINSEILQLASSMNSHNINWPRNAYLINRGLHAVADFNRDHEVQIKTLLHIAQPENALWWFAQAETAGVTQFDIIGLSYYPTWSSYGLDAVAGAMAELKTRYDKEVMIVETAYPWTLEGFDAAGNILGQSALVPGYPASPEGQYNYLMQLSREVIRAGGMGVIYWEPAWVSTSCSTLWGQGSHWENASFFHHPSGNETLKSMQFFKDARALYLTAPN